jgi:hypothetical protein
MMAENDRARSGAAHAGAMERGAADEAVVKEGRVGKEGPRDGTRWYFCPRELSCS